MDELIKQIEANRLATNGHGNLKNKSQEFVIESPKLEEWLNYPKPLDLTLKPVEGLDDDCLPKVLVDWLRPASKVIGCPLDFLVLSAIVTTGNLIGSRLRVKPLEHSNWFVVPNLYGGLVGLPSTKKTPALNETRQPILELQTKARKEFVEASKDYEIGSKFYEKKSKEIYGKAKNVETIKLQLASLEKPEQPKLRRYETNDVTASKLIQFLAENPIGLMLFRDELAGWLRSLEAEYDKSARAFFLELWQGAIAYELSRVDGREIQLTSGTFSIIGGIQPSKLQKYVTEAYSFDNSDGFLQRFVFAYPDIDRAEKPTQSDYEAQIQGYELANKIFHKLATYDFNGRTRSANGDLFQSVNFNRDAQLTINEWREEIETEAELIQIEDEPFSSFLYKLPKNCFAIALIFHCLENITADSFPSEISLETTLKAITYTEVLTSHARRVFALGENQVFAMAQSMLGKIRKGDLQQGFTKREIMRKKWSGLRSPADVEEVLSLLVDYGYLKVLETTEGRPTTKHFFHPSLEREVEK